MPLPSQNAFIHVSTIFSLRIVNFGTLLFVVVCKGCIVKYLQSNAQCPICGTVVNETHPLTSLRADRTMQDIVYKMVPELEISE